MIRLRLLNVAAIASLLLSVAVLIGIAFPHRVEWPNGGNVSNHYWVTLESSRALTLSIVRELPAPDVGPPEEDPAYNRWYAKLAPTYLFNRYGFNFEHTPALRGLFARDGTSRLVRYGAHWVFTIPYIALLGLFLLLPVVFAVRLLVRWLLRARDGQCSTCLYNLTGNTSGVCPECGTAVPVKHESAA